MGFLRSRGMSTRCLYEDRDAPHLRSSTAHAPATSGVRRCRLDLYPAESANDLEDLLVDVPPEERVLPDLSTPRLWDVDSFVVALSVVNDMRKASEQSLEVLV